jgi:hypothetical protein
MLSAVSGIADREQRLRDLAEASVAVGAEVSLEDVLQKTVETAAGWSLRAMRRWGYSTAPAHTWSAS